MEELKKDSLIEYVRSQDVEVIIKNIKDELSNVPEIKAITCQFDTIKAMAEKTTVINEIEKAQGLEKLDKIDDLKKGLKKLILPIKDISNKVHKSITGYEGGVLLSLNDSTALIMAKMAVYQREVDRKQRELQEKADARARAEEERLIKEKLRQAEGHQEAGREEKAQQRIDEANQIHVASSVIEITEHKIATEKVTGGMKPVLKAIIIDPKLAKKWLAGQLGGLDIMDINESRLNKFVNQHEIEFVPGLRIVPDYKITKRKRG